MVATRMRILLVTPLFLPSLSGAAIYFETLSRSLVRLAPDAEVTILTRRVRGAPTSERRGAVRVLRLLPAAREDGGPALVERARALAGAAIVLGVSWWLRSDVVHYHTLASYRGLGLLAPLFRAPLVGDMRDLAARHEGASLDRYRHCRLIVCASENIAAFLRAGGVPEDRLVHVPIPFALPRRAAPDAVDAVRRRHGVEPAWRYALFVGAVIPYKGVRELVEAMEIVWREMPGLHLVIAGGITPSGDAEFGGLRQRAASEPRLHVLGAVPHEEVLALIQGADVFVLPSRTEGLPRSGLEALALGVRVVLPAGIPEFERACPEAILDAVEPRAIAGAILAALRRGPSNYPVESHDADVVANRMLALYRRVAGAHAARPGRLL